MQFIKNNIAHFRFFLPFAAQYRKQGFLTLLATCAAGCTDAAVAWSLRPYMDGLMTGHDFSRLYYFPLLIVVFTVLQGILKQISNYLTLLINSGIAMDIKLRMFEKLLRNEADFFDATTSGTALKNYNHDVDRACNGFFNNGKSLLLRVTTSLSLLVVMFCNSWILASVALAFLLLAVYPLTRIREKTRKVDSRDHLTSTSILTSFNEAFAGNRIVASFGLYGHLTAKLRAAIDSQSKLALKLMRHTGSLSVIVHFVIALGLAAAIWLQGYLVATNRLTTGNFISFLAALLLLYNPIKNMSGNLQRLVTASISMDRLQKNMNRQPTIVSAPNARSLSRFCDEIRYEEVHFAYSRGSKVLHDVSFTIKSGETVAFVGESGGGKSTLVNLLPRFYDVSSGRIEIDGVDIRGIEIESLRASMSVVFQDNFLFDGTIRENILMGRPVAGEEEIDLAVTSACLREFVASLDKGLETMIGERGIRLSGGEKQRVAIARAFIKNAPILILDEATSSLDNRSEAVVQQAIDNLGKGRTVLLVAHRLSSIVNADRIFVIDGGGIVETGTHRELIAVPDGKYAALYNRQLTSTEADAT